MKKLQLLNWMLIAFLALQFTSCTNEPLEGEFPQQDTSGEIVPGSFTALVNDVAFTAAFTTASVNVDGDFTITGVSSNNTAILLTASPLANGSYDLTLNPTNNDNGASYFDVQSETFPFLTLGDIGGGGTLTITNYNETDLIISGTFNFIAARAALDADGEPITDANGDVIIQNASITQGVFTDIQMTFDENPGGGDPGGGGGSEDPVDVDQFFALVNGQEHEDQVLTTTLNTVGNDMVFKVEAQTATGSMMRIDIPFDMGIGTFDMEDGISDGTKLIGIYNPNIGGENLSSNPGSITFTEFDTQNGVIAASFSFTARDPLGEDPSVYQVTQGSFTVYFEGTEPPALMPFKAVIDGADFEPSGVNDILEITDQEVNGMNVKLITATLENGRTMKIGFPSDTITPGVYPMSTDLENGDQTIGLYTREGSSIEFVSNPGVLTIESYDQETGDISATFSFTAVNPDGVDPTVIQITEGVFNLNLL
ncbi:MAG: Uncharacterised protein [Flavobacteriaceae bacterium]|nr:MAG: Uncharacterised protein [Flavobacteriaceae bacterium]